MEAAHQREPGKTAALVAEVEASRAELAFDFRHLLGISITDIGGQIPWDEAVDLVEQLGRHPGSHYWSSKQGFTRVTDWIELSSMLTAQTAMNLTREKGSEPVRLPIPVRDPAEVVIDPEERDELVAYARATAPFPLDD